MGCLKLTYQENESSLLVSRELESDAVNWQVWTAEKGLKETKWVRDDQNGGLIDLSGANSGELIVDYLREYALAKRADPSLERPYLHDFIDLGTRFRDLSDYTKHTGNSSMISGNRQINGVWAEVKVLPTMKDFNNHYNPNTTDNRLGGTGFREYQAAGNLYSEAYYKNASGSGIIVFSFMNNRAAASKLYKYVSGR